MQFVSLQSVLNSGSNDVINMMIFETTKILAFNQGIGTLVFTKFTNLPIAILATSIKLMPLKACCLVQLLPLVFP